MIAGAPSTADAQAGAGRLDSLAEQQKLVFQNALHTVGPSIVRIDTIGGAQPVISAVDPTGHSRTAPAFRQADGPTTGLVWSADGYILTSSFNFVREPSVATVTLSDGRRFVARLVSRDYAARLALLKIDAYDLPTPEWIEPADLRPGQWTLAAGYGYGGDGPAVSIGVLSAVSRMSGQAVQTDARISPAHYGGPLFDIEGRVLGVCVPMGPGDDELAGVEWYDSGIGFAIHRDQLLRRMPRLIKGEDLQRGLLGINLDLRRRVVGDATGDVADTPPEDGVLITEEPRGPAAEAGLKAGDVITLIDGAPTPSLIDFKRAVSLKAAGDKVSVSYRRGVDSATVAFTLWSADSFRKPDSDEPK